MTAQVQEMKADVEKPLSNLSTDAQKTSAVMVEVVKLKIPTDLVDGWEKTKPHFQVESAHFAVSAGDELLRHSSDAQSSLRKNSVLFSSCVTKALDVGSSNSKSPSVSAKKIKRPRKASGLKGAKKTADGPSSSNDNIVVDSV